MKNKKLQATIMLFAGAIWAGILEGKAGRVASANIYEVHNEDQMYCQIVNSIKQRESEVSIRYPGIYRDILRHKQRKYRSFFQKLSDKDSYAAGCVSAIQVKYCRSEDTAVTFFVEYRTTLLQERYVNRKVKKLVSKKRKCTTLEKIKWGRDYLVRHMKYDKRFYTAYDAFYRGKGNCMAYAYAYLRIMQELHVPCIYVSSKDHAWNMVRLKGKWYHVDVTWDDGTGTYLYFLKGKKDFFGHSPILYGTPKKSEISKKAFKFH